MKKRTIKDIKISRISPQDNIINDNKIKRIESNLENKKNSKRKVVVKKANMTNTVNTMTKKNINSKNIDLENNNIPKDINQLNINKKMETFSKTKKNKKGKSNILFIIFGLIATFFLFNNFLNSAKIEIEPKKEAINLEKVIFNVNKASESDKKDSEKVVGELYYNTIQKNFESEKVELKVDAVKEVEEFATGKIKITNNLAKTMQLIKRTRFELNGKEYRIKNTISIPKKSSKTVIVVADKPGDTYNNDKTGEKYNIPGLKNAKESYENIFGTSVTEMNGGFSGTKAVPNKEDLAKKKEELIKKMSAKLRAEIRATAKTSKDIFFKSISQEKHDFEYVTEGEKTFLVLKSYFVTPFIKKENFDEVIINKAIKGNLVEGVIDDRSDLEYSFLDTDGLDYNSGDKFKVKISGKAQVIWKIDKERILKRAKGSKTSVLKKEVKENFPVEDIEISISPFWKKTLPSNMDKIDIKISK